MIRNDIAQSFEPETRDLGEDFTFVRNSRTEDVVERRDPIGGDDEQLVAEVVDVPDFSGAVGLTITEGGIENRS